MARRVCSQTVAYRATDRQSARPAQAQAQAQAIPADRAKLFANGRSQAVRLPKEFRMSGTEVAIRREGDRIILEPIGRDTVDANGWPIDYFADMRRLREGVDVPVIATLSVRVLSPENIDPTVAWKHPPAEKGDSGKRSKEEVLMRTILDTNHISFACRGDARVLARWARTKKHDLCLTSVTLAELEFSTLRHPKPEPWDRLWRAQIRDLPVLSFAKAEAGEHARIRDELRGSPIGDRDLMIAAIARAHGMVVTTSNVGDFRRVRGLAVDDWTR